MAGGVIKHPRHADADAADLRQRHLGIGTQLGNLRHHACEHIGSTSLRIGGRNVARPYATDGTINQGIGDFGATEVDTDNHWFSTVIHTFIAPASRLAHK